MLISEASEDSPLKKQQKFALICVEKHGSTLAFFDDFKNNEEIVLLAIKTYRDALQYANEELRNNESFVLEAIKINHYSIVYASSNLLESRDFIIKAIKIKGRIITFLDENIKSDKDLVLLAIKNTDYLTKDMIMFLLHDKEVMIAEIKKNISTYHYLSEELKKDTEIKKAYNRSKPCFVPDV